MIPKTIHYCWFGGNPLPESAKKCIASWKNKVIFSEKEYPNAPHVFYIHGFPKGLNALSLFHGLCGHRKMDQFDFVHWFNTGEYKRNY